jgi:hypothetical protein
MDKHAGSGPGDPRFESGGADHHEHVCGTLGPRQAVSGQQ